jgi:hypothetical protein
MLSSNRRNVLPITHYTSHRIALSILIAGTLFMSSIISGCNGHLIERSTIASRFESMHGCQITPEDVEWQGEGRYVVRGCCIQSHFTCLDIGNDDDAFTELVSGNSDSCIHEHSTEIEGDCVD